MLKRNRLGDPDKIKRLEDYDLTDIDDFVFYIVVKTRKGEEVFNSVKVRRDGRHLLVENGKNKNGKIRYRSFEMKTRVPILFQK